MQSRRQLLQQALVLPLIPDFSGLRYSIVSEQNCLSQESARGYTSILAEPPCALSKADLIIFAGACGLRRERLLDLRARAAAGATLIWESSAFADRPHSSVSEAFGLSFTGETGAGRDMYVHYSWPALTLVRSFGTPLPVAALPGEAIAHLDGRPVGLKKRIGQGTLIYLGSMLGPHLLAGDREAIKLTQSLLRVRA